jgi:iron-sulfur cluster repair protein YtfE (RIC family)
MLTSPREIPETITECLKADHDRLDRLLEETVAVLERGDLRGLRLRFPEFARHLRDHMRFEEDFMFPVVERTLCHAEGPICVMRRDHREIEDRLAAMAAALYLGDTTAFRDEHLALVMSLENHNGREERVLYPAIDHILDDAARARLVEEIRLHL